MKHRGHLLLCDSDRNSVPTLVVLYECMDGRWLVTKRSAEDQELDLLGQGPSRDDAILNSYTTAPRPPSPQP
jgi:hypothetical protein